MFILLRPCPSGRLPLSLSGSQHGLSLNVLSPPASSQLTLLYPTAAARHVQCPCSFVALESNVNTPMLGSNKSIINCGANKASKP